MELRRKKMPVKVLKKLPKKARLLWEKTYQAAKAKYGEERAAKIAWAAVKKQYKKEGDKWVLKGRDLNFSGKIKMTSEKLVCRSENIGELSNDYFLEGYLATPTIAQDGIYFTKDLLKDLHKQIKDLPINIKGDLEHIGTKMRAGRKVPEDYPTYDNFMKIVDTNVDDTGLWIRAKLDKYSENFPILWNRIKEGFYDAFSIEIALDKANMFPELVDGKYVRKATKGRIKKFTLTGDPVDTYARVTSFYTK